MLPLMAIENGDDRSFVEELFRQYGKKIYLLAYNILNDVGMAEDCLQNVMKKVIDHVGLFRDCDINKMKSLIVKCTRNAAIDLYRAERRRRSFETDLGAFEEDSDSEFADSAGTSEEIIINEENKRRLMELINLLEPAYRDVLLMKYQMEMKNTDIASVLGVSEDVVNTRIYRAKKILLEKRRDELYDIKQP